MTEKPLPTTYDDLVDIISAKYENLSKRLKQIASYALDNPSEFAIDTIAETADKAAVQPSALVRFAKAFGYDGFSDIQKIFQKRLLEKAPSYATRLKAIRSGTRNTPYDLLNQFAEANIRQLQYLQQEIQPEKLAQAVRLMDRADTIYIFAMRRAFPLAAYIYYSLSSMGRRAQLIDNTGGLYMQQAQQISKNDMLIVASFAEYTPYVSQVSADAHNRGISVVAITDHPLSPLTPVSNICFHVKEASVYDFRALSASMCLAQSLVIGLGVKGYISKEDIYPDNG